VTRSLCRAAALNRPLSKNVLGGGEPHSAAHRKGGLPLAKGLVQDEAAVGLHWPAEYTGSFTQNLRSQPQAQAVEQGAQGHLDRAVDYHA